MRLVIGKMKFTHFICSLFTFSLWITCGTAAQLINWGTCPPSQNEASTLMIDCANLSFPLNYKDESMGNVTAFVRRIYAAEPTNSSVWVVAGGPGDSTRSLVPVCDYFVGANPSFTCYAQDARGTGLSSYMSCGKVQPAGPFDPYNSTQVEVYRNCFEKIISQYGDQLQYYST